MNLRTLRSQELRVISEFLLDLYEPVPTEEFGDHVVRLATEHFREFAHTNGFDEVDRRTGAYRIACNRFEELKSYEPVVAAHIDQNPSWAYAAAGGEERVLMITDFLTQREFARTDLYQLAFKPMGTHHQIAVSVPTPTHLCGLTTYTHRPCTETQRALLAVLAPHIERAHAQAQRRSADLDALPVSRLTKLGLTPREAEVLHWVAEGKRDAEIAIILGTATRTVCKHVERILAKLSAETRLAAVAAARTALRSMGALVALVACLP